MSMRRSLLLPLKFRKQTVCKFKNKIKQIYIPTKIFVYGTHLTDPSNVLALRTPGGCRSRGRAGRWCRAGCTSSRRRRGRAPPATVPGGSRTLTTRPWSTAGRPPAESSPQGGRRPGPPRPGRSSCPRSLTTTAYSGSSGAGFGWVVLP